MSVQPEEAYFVSLPEVGESSAALIDEFFSGEMLTWAAKRAENLGDVIVPKVIYIEEIDGHQHKVAWVEHQGTNPATQIEFHNHHVVCDCVLCKRFDNGLGGIDTSLCDTMARALEAKGHLIGNKFQAQSDVFTETGAVNLMLSRSHEDVEANEPVGLTEFDLENMAMLALESILRSDSRYPEEWHGNAVSGFFSIDEASTIVDQSIPRIIKVATLLQKSGKADFDGENLSLAA